MDDTRAAEDQPLVLRHFIPKDREGTYYALPFPVPAGAESVTVTYDYPARGRSVMKDLKPSNTVDLGLCNGRGAFLGWSGSAHKSITVGRYRSSPGYLTDPMAPGEWQILIGAYHIEPEGCEVTYTITFTYPAQRLYAGDLHMHSTASDGVFSPRELGERAKAAGLDFIAVADHNNYAENLHLPFVPGMTYIPAVEWTHYKGHMNFFGVKAPFENGFIANTKEEMRALTDRARAMGAAVSVNHPKCPFCPYLWEDDTAFDLMEIWNGPFTPRNARALAFWHTLLTQGRRIPIVGGSDFHKPGVVRLGHPTTVVRADSPSAEDLLSAIRAGHAYVTEGPKGPRLTLGCGDAFMGDEAAFDPGTPVTAETDAKRVFFVTDKGKTEIRVQNGAARFSAAGARFVYAEIRSSLTPGRVLAVTNPIYFKEEEA